MDDIILLINEYCECVGIDCIAVYAVPDTQYILIVLNDAYIGADSTEVVFKGIETIFKEHGIKTED